MGPFARRRLADELESLDWPHREHSQAVAVGGARWHVQTLGASATGVPTVLFAHGAGASTHSFREVAAILAKDVRAIAVDLPGHGFSQGFSAKAMSLVGMGDALNGLLSDLRIAPDYAVGHSAGAALLLDMASRRLFAPRRIFSVNGALKPMQSSALLSPLARLLFVNPLAPKLFAWRARRGATADRLLGMTGSSLSVEDRRLYRALFEREDHVVGALGMMAGWDLDPLIVRLPRLETPTTLVAAADDAMVKASVSDDASRRIPGAELVETPTGGHLLHEVRPAFVAELIRSRLKNAGGAGA